MMLKRTTKISVLSLFWLLCACDSASETATQTEEIPAIVDVTTLTAEPVSQEHIFPGRVAAYRIAQIRPQVSGIVTEMKFNQGSELTPGQALFQIDPAPFKADVNSAAASLQKAQASYRQLQAKANRLTKIKHNVTTRVNRLAGSVTCCISSFTSLSKFPARSAPTPFKW